jgi:hypothetical protein
VYFDVLYIIIIIIIIITTTFPSRVRPVAYSDFTTSISFMDVPLLFHLGIIFKGDVRNS